MPTLKLNFLKGIGEREATWHMLVIWIGCLAIGVSSLVTSTKQGIMGHRCTAGKTFWSPTRALDIECNWRGW